MAVGHSVDAARWQPVLDDLMAKVARRTRLEHLAITRKTVTGLTDRLRIPAGVARAPGLPAHLAASMRRPAPYEPGTYAAPSATNCCRRTWKAPEPSSSA